METIFKWRNGAACYQEDERSQDGDSTEVNHPSTVATDSSLPSTWNDQDTDLGFESSNTALTSNTEFSDIQRGK